VKEWLHTSDLHGQRALYEELVGIVASWRPPVVVIGGDLCPHAMGAPGIAEQRVFLQGFLVETARRLREASPRTRLLLLMGNDDWAANLDCLEERHGDLWLHLHGRSVEVEGLSVSGLSWVPISPMSIKDWERWEDGGPETPRRLDGWVSRGRDMVGHRFDPDCRAPTLAGALEALAGQANAGRTIYVLHGPPHGTRCDLIGPGTHVGSRATRAFIERHQPPLVLAGHIHESPRIPGGSYVDRIGRTVVANPGQFQAPRLCAVWVDPRRPEATLRHTVFDPPRE
jgi:Icc-related predicted phosphoesterase